MRKFLLSLILVFTGLSSYACFTGYNVGYLNGCFTLNSDGTETVTMTLDDLCGWSNVPSPTWSINIWIQKTASLSTNPSDYAVYNIMPTDPTFGGGHYTFTFTVSAADAMPADSCFTFYAIVDPSGTPWNANPAHTFYPAFTLCPCLDPAKACYYVDSVGDTYLKFVSKSPVANTNIAMWQIYPSGIINAMYDGSSYISTTPDDDGIDYDYLYGIYPSSLYAYSDTATKCDTFLFNYYYDYTQGIPYGAGGNYDYNNVLSWYNPTAANICPCPITPSDGCYSEFDSSGLSYLKVRLVYNSTIHTLNGTNMYIWIAGNTTPHAPTMITLDPNGLDYDYTYILPMPGSGDFDKNNCFEIYCYNNETELFNSENTDPATFGSLFSVCPCCTNNISYYITSGTGLKVNFESVIPGTWQFGDGSAPVHAGNTSHTYSHPGTFIVTLTHSDANGNPCISKDTICVADNKAEDRPTICEFSLIMDGGYGVTIPAVWTFPIPNPHIQYVINWGDGNTTTTNGTVNELHPYSSTGSYTVCMTKNILDANWQVWISCTECINICITEKSHFRAAGNTSQMQALEDDIQLAPNPTSDISTASFRLNKESNVKITIVDMTGRVVSTPVDTKMFSKGSHKVDISTQNLSSGVYIINLQVGSSITTKRLSVVK